MIRSLKGKVPKIHPPVFASDAAYIVGDVEIGENSSIWPGAVLRGDYGKKCSIQDKCVLHTDDYLELGDNVLMTHGAVVHGGRVGSNVLIGVNAAVLEDAHIGNYCLIGAGAVVLAGARMPDHSLAIGVPGRAIPLTERQEQRPQDPSANYVRNARIFIDAGL